MIQTTLIPLRIKKTLIYAILVLFAVICIVPIWILLVNGTRSDVEIHSGLSLFASHHLKENQYRLALFGFDFHRGFVNSLLISASSTALAIYFSALTAYGLTMYSFPLRNSIFNLILALIAIPPQLGFVGFYKFMIDLRWLDNYVPLILPAIAAPTTVFFLAQYIKSIIHSDLLDAARIDGSHEFSTFNRVILPMLSPGLATMAIFSFTTTWNSFFMPFLLLNSKILYTLPMQVRFFNSQEGNGPMYLGLTMSVVPLLIFYLFASKYILAGVTLGGVKE